MKFLFASIVFSLLVFVVSAQNPCLPEGINFTTQEEIDSFQVNYPGCAEIEGDIVINSDDITSLEGLNVLTSLLGDLTLFETGISNFSGLENICIIEGDFNVGFQDLYGFIGNPILIDFYGFNSLISIGGNFRILENDSLVSLVGLDNLSSIGGNLEVQRNFLLTDLLGLNNLDSIAGHLVIRHNTYLNDLTELNNLNSIGGNLNIFDNENLISLSGIDNINSGTIQNIWINLNDQLSECHIQSICDYLVTPNGIAFFHSNAPGCNNYQEVTEACGITSCLPEGIIFSTQAQIDSFQVNYPGCTEIEGNVKIGSYGPYGTDITNLTSLNVLSSIGGDLTINGNEMTNLAGLENLIYVGGSLTIHSNHDLADLAGLNGLDSIGEDLDIHNCSVLTSLTKLQSLTFVGGNLTIGDIEYGNPQLSSLQGLEGISSIQGSLEIGNNDALISLSGLDNIVSVGNYVWITHNSSLNDLTALANLNNIGGGLSVTWNSVINLSGMEGLDSIPGILWIGGNDSLVNLSGLENLKYIEGLAIGNNSIFMGGGNPLLTDLEALENLLTVEGNIEISGNISLMNLNGLNNIEAGSIIDLNIRNNDLLSECNIQNICDYLSAPNGSVTIENNGPGCSSIEEVEEACGSVGIKDQRIRSFMLHPNPTGNGTFTLTLDNPLNLHLSCFNTFGQQIHHQEISRSKTLINVSSWQPGIYLAVVYEDGKPVGRAKFVVE